jgi:hypothetical protein
MGSWATRFRSTLGTVAVALVAAGTHSHSALGRTHIQLAGHPLQKSDCMLDLDASIAVASVADDDEYVAAGKD